MSLTPLVTAATAASESAHREELPVHPYVVGAITLLLFVAMLVALLSIGKGREHS